MAEQVEPGDVVCLASGGPHMTVNSLPKAAGGDVVDCLWFVGTDIRHAEIDTAALVVISRKGSGAAPRASAPSP
jgi:uncharacterized protein YodC (DUF2158 family)